MPKFGKSPRSPLSSLLSPLSSLLLSDFSLIFQNGVLIAATQENIRAFMEADVDLLDCFEGHYYDLKLKLSDLCVEIEPSEVHTPESNIYICVHKQTNSKSDCI